MNSDKFSLIKSSLTASRWRDSSFPLPLKWDISCIHSKLVISLKQLLNIIEYFRFVKLYKGNYHRKRYLPIFLENSYLGTTGLNFSAHTIFTNRRYSPHQSGFYSNHQAYCCSLALSAVALHGVVDEVVYRAGYLDSYKLAACCSSFRCSI